MIKIIKGKTLEQYNKKYRNRRHRLLKFTKKEVKDFDRKNKTNIKDFLLQGKKWWLIDNTYYEIPSSPRLTWFRNLNAGVQAGVCLLGAGAIATSVAVPLVLLNQNKNKTVEPSVTIQGADFDKKASHIELNKESTIVLKQKGTKEITDVEYVKVGDKKLASTEYTFDKPTLKVTIKAEAMTSTKIEIKVKNEEEVTITLDKHSATMHPRDTLQLNATVTGTTETVLWEVTSNASVCTVTQTGLVTAKSEGACVIKASVAGKEDRCTITVEEPVVPEFDEINIYNMDSTIITELYVAIGETVSIKVLGNDQARTNVSGDCTISGEGERHCDYEKKTDHIEITGNVKGEDVIKISYGTLPEKSLTVKVETQLEKFLRLYKPYNDTFQDTNTEHVLDDIEFKIGETLWTTTSISYSDKTESTARECTCDVTGLQDPFMLNYEFNILKEELKYCEEQLGWSFQCIVGTNTVGLKIYNTESVLAGEYAFNSDGYLIRLYGNGADYNISYKNAPTQKNKFLRLYDEYKLNYQNSSKEYTTTEIPQIKTTGDGSGTFDIISIETTGTGSTRKTNISYSDDGQTVTKQIDTNKDLSSVINQLPDNGDDVITRYSFNENFISYDEYENPSFRKFKINKFGYVESLQQATGYELTITGDPKLKEITVSFDEASATSIGLSVSLTDKIISEEKTAKFTIDCGGESVTYNLVGKVNGNEVYRQDGITIEVRGSNYYVISTTDIKDFSTLSKTDTIIFSVEKPKVEGVSLKYVDTEDDYGKLTFSSGLPESIELTAKSLTVTFTYTQKNKGTCTIYVCEDSSDPVKTKVTQSENIDEGRTTCTLDLSGATLSKYSKLCVIGVFGS